MKPIGLALDEDDDVGFQVPVVCFSLDEDDDVGFQVPVVCFSLDEDDDVGFQVPVVCFLLSHSVLVTVIIRFLELSFSYY